MRSRTPSDLRGLCPRCFLASAMCLCAQIPKLRLRTRITILRHAKEAWSTSNTGRLAALAIDGLRIVDYGAPGGPDLRDIMLDPGSALVFPRSDGDPAADPKDVPPAIVILDGTWPQARRALHRRLELERLPRLSFARAREIGGRLRRTRDEAAMSTLEAVACAVARLEGEALAEPLFSLYRARAAARVSGSCASQASFLRGPSPPAAPSRHRAP